MLYFGKELTQFLPQSGIDMFRFSGTEKDTDILDHKTEILPIPQLLEVGERFIKYNSSTKAVFNQSETRREDVQEYPEFVVRELLSNAFAHRDWSIFGQRVKIDIFSDRLEIFSPGKLPNTLELESAISGISYYRNPIISQMLKDYSLVEKSGRGLLKILNYYKKNKLSLPRFDATNFFLKVTLYPIR
jgi:ATP-dependent DNA helicase RecG